MFERWKWRGRPVAVYECRGCMASNHQLEYIGFVDGVVRQKVGEPIPMLNIRVVKYENRDVRDVKLGYRTEILSRAQEVDGFIVVYN